MKVFSRRGIVTEYFFLHCVLDSSWKVSIVKHGQTQLQPWMKDRRGGGGWVVYWTEKSEVR